MNVEVKIDENYQSPQIVIYTNKMSNELSIILEQISGIVQKNITAYKDKSMYILNQNDIESIYSENGKVFARCSNEQYIVKNRLYEIETILDSNQFIRISNSEIININKIENIDLKIIGTLIFNFKSGHKSYSSRRYIPKIKKILEI